MVRLRRPGRRAVAALVAVVGGLALSAGVMGAWTARGLPPPPGLPLPEVPAFEAVRAGWHPSDVTVLDRRGEPLESRRVDPRGRRLEWVPLDAVSPAAVASIVAAEDRRFFSHRGVDGQALGGAARAMAEAALLGGPVRGGSTITMQVAALVDPGLARPGARRTLRGKWRQIRAAWALGQSWSRAEVLEAYLNLAPFRGEVRGIDAAARLLFRKAPHGLDDAEAAVLAGLLRNPNAGAGPLLRRAGLAAQARVAGPVTPAAPPDEAALAAAVARAVAPAPFDPTIPALAPHLTTRLLALPDGDEPGPGPWSLQVTTTIDAALQRHAIATLRRHLLALRDRGVRDGAVLVADNATGEVLAYVGGAGDLASRAFVDGVRARRQAGSTLKPFLYALAFESRLLTPASRLDDSPLEILAGNGLYRPRNYDEAFRGPVPAAAALAASLNVPAVRTLELVGVEPFAERLVRLGFGLTEPGDFYGPALALGSADVTLEELVAAYRALATGGTWSALRLRPGPPGPSRRVLSPQAAFLVADALAGRETRSATFGLESALATRSWTAVKTGTSKEMRDNWTVGFSDRYTVGVWVGNLPGGPMHDVSGVTGAAPIWRDVMGWLHGDQASRPPAPPPGVVGRDGGWFLAGTEPTPGAAGAVRGTAGRPPRIVAPSTGTLVALDPDIPPGRQRVVFETEVEVPGAAFHLDGVRLAAAGPGPVLWAPEAGHHELTLERASGEVLDRVAFEVRGGRKAAPLP